MDVATQSTVPIEQVRLLLTGVRSAGLTTDSPRPARSAAVSYQPPLTVRFASSRARRVFAELAGPSRLLDHRWTVVVGGVIVVAGIAAGAVQFHRIVGILGEPLPLGALLAVLTALFAATLVHELAHGMALTGFGGVPRRAGVMLFYLSPAFFVDVTDAWRLPDRRRRAAVALAGPFVHAVLAAAAMVAALAASGTAASILVSFALAAASIAVFNLVPFVRFDGYLALMALLDRPHLRRDALAAFGSRAFGKTGDDTVPLILFGAACAITPLILTLLALNRIGVTLEPLGSVGVVAALIAVAGVTVAVGVSALRYLRATAPSVGRLCLVLAVVLGLLTALALTPIANERRLGFHRDRGELSAVALSAAELRGIPDGAPVRLLTNGVVLQSPIGTARWTGEALGDDRVPLESLAPASVPGATIDVVTAPLAAQTLPESDMGVAVVRLGESRPAIVGLWCDRIAPTLGLPSCNPLPPTKGSS